MLQFLLSPQGAVQMYVQIIATVDDREDLVDDVFAYGQQIPADGTFRRITYLSFKNIALVGANVAVRCIGDVGTPDCSVPTPPPPPTTTAATIIATSSVTAVPGVQADQNHSGQISNTASNEVNSPQEGIGKIMYL